MKIALIFSVMLHTAISRFEDHETVFGNYYFLSGNGVIGKAEYYTSLQTDRESRTVSQLSDDDLPPVYIRHVPSPVQQEPVVPIISVDPPNKVVSPQQPVPQVQYHQNPPRKVIVVKDIPQNAQLARSLFVENVPTHILERNGDIPVTVTQRPVQTELVNNGQQHAKKVVLQKELNTAQHQPRFITQNVQLVDGFTQEHLAYVAALKAMLPQIE